MIRRLASPGAQLACVRQIRQRDHAQAMAWLPVSQRSQQAAVWLVVVRGKCGDIFERSEPHMRRIVAQCQCLVPGSPMPDHVGTRQCDVLHHVVKHIARRHGAAPPALQILTLARLERSLRKHGGYLRYPLCTSKQTTTCISSEHGTRWALNTAGYCSMRMGDIAPRLSKLMTSPQR
jgi:hypothetical protein